MMVFGVDYGNFVGVVGGGYEVVVVVVLVVVVEEWCCIDVGDGEVVDIFVVD